MAIKIGQIAVKIAGRERGRRCVILNVIDKNFVLVTGPKKLTGVRRRRSNIDHLAVTDKKIAIERGASDEEVLKALENASLLDYMRAQAKPSR